MDIDAGSCSNSGQFRVRFQIPTFDKNNFYLQRYSHNGFLVTDLKELAGISEYFEKHLIMGRIPEPNYNKTATLRREFRGIRIPRFSDLNRNLLA